MKIFRLSRLYCKKYSAVAPLKVMPPLGEQYMPFMYPLMLIIETGGQNILFNSFPCGKKEQPFGETTFYTGASETIFVPVNKIITIKLKQCKQKKYRGNFGVLLLPIG